MKHLYKLLFVFISLWLSNCIDDPVMNTQLQNGIAPEISETSLVSKGPSIITLKAYIIKENGSQIKECGICWSLLSENSPQKNMSEKRYQKASIIENKEFQVSLSGLEDNTDYYVYAYAINESDTAYSTVGVYKTILGVGEVYTCPVDSLYIKATSAIISGKIKSRGEGIEQLGFYLSEVNDKPSEKDSVILYQGDIQEIDSFSCYITNIKPSTKYYIRAFATNQFGEFSFNVDSFITTDGKPRLGILSLDSISFTHADFSAILLSEGDSSLTTFGFCWGTMDEPSIENADTLQCSEIKENKFYGRISNLEPKTEYLVRAYATNVFGTVYSNEESFYPKSQLPTIKMYPINKDSIINGSAIIEGVLQNEGMSQIRTIGFCWSSTNKNPTIMGQDCSFEEIALEELDDKKKYTYKLINLIGSTTYYVNTYAVNESGTQYGEVQSFSTPHILSNKNIYAGDRRVFSAGFSVNDEAFIVGGDLGSERTNEVYQYNVDLDEWSLSAPYIKAYSQMATTVNNGNAYIIGGTDNSLYATEAQQYIASSNVWVPLESLPEGKGRYDAVSFVYRDSLYLLGGITDKGYSQDLWKYSGDTWLMVNNNFPVYQQRGIALVANDTVYAGLGNNAGLKKGFWMSTDSLTVWENVPGTLPYNMGNVSAAIHYLNEQWNSFFMIDNNGKIWEYNLSDKKWIEHHTILKRMNNYHMFILKDNIYILGQDRFESNFFMMYDPVWDPGK